MADTKITALTAISTVDPAVDVLPIVDVSDTTMAASGTTKKITSNQILGAGGTATLASATITGDLTVDTSTLKVDSANNRVGIGTASPATALNVVAGTSGINTTFDTPSAGDTRFELKNNGTRAGYVYWDTSEVRLFADSGRALNFYPNGTLGMTLNSTGLGVGGSPAYQIHARKDQAAYTTIAVDNANALAAGTGSQFLLLDATTIASWFRRNRDGTGNTDIGYKDTLRFRGAIAGTERTDMLIDTAGNVGVGVTPSAWQSDYRALQIRGASLSNNAAASDLWLSANLFVNSSLQNTYIATAAASRYRQTSGTHIWDIAPSGTAGNAISFTQAMTLDASGRLLVGKAASNFATVGSEIKANGSFTSTQSDSTNGSTAWDTYSTGASAYRFYVGMAGTVFATNTTISAISDARFKENIQDLDVGLGAILALKPRKFDWKAGKGKDIKGDRGFIAQEFEQVFPQLVDEWRDNAPEGEAPYKSVRQDLIPVLVKAIQELTARVEALEA